MSKIKTESEIRDHKNKSIQILDSYLESLIQTNPKKADLISYWLHTYANYLNFEESFDPKKNKNYERGDVVRVNLGFNIGSEHGGRHYAVVLDVHNFHSSPIISIIPLSSSDGSNIHSSSVFLGDDIFKKINSKLIGMQQAYRVELSELKQEQHKYEEDSYSQNDNQREAARISEKLLKDRVKELHEKQKDLNALKSEISHMKPGSVALVSQITTISKIRIEDPVNLRGVLNGIKISSENLDLIDDKIKELFLKKS